MSNLLSELEAVVGRIENDGSHRRCVDFLRTHHAEIAEDAKDAARYRWLRDKSVGQWEHPICVSQERTYRDEMRYVGPLASAALDTAIDAAMSAREGQG